jgi:hypothetical protein
LIVIFSILTGAFIGVAGAFITWSISETDDPHQSRKLDEIREALPSINWFGPVRRLAGKRE